ncbi:MAG: choice-of-anchor Q domain-containing protein, partial [Planctomycetota bacterium]
GIEPPETPILANCIFIGNSSDSRGGAIYNEFFNINVDNCVFKGNRAILGGAIWNEAYLESELATISNCTFSDNIASNAGGGIYCESDYDNIHVSNCILWGDTPDEIHAGIRPPLITYSDIQGGWPGLGNIDTDPLFVDPNGPDNIPGTEDDNLHLLPYSPCIDAGDPTGDYTDQTDMDGEQRVLYDNVDIGADEVFPIAGDIDMDGDVDFTDYAYFSMHWLKGK